MLLSAVLALAALVASAGGFGCTGCADGEQLPASSSGAGGTGAAGASGSSSSGSTSASSGQGGAECPAAPLPPGVPEGWVRMPGAPCECDVYMAPDPSRASPVSWASCGDGCTELVVDWSVAQGYRLLAQVGAAGGGSRYLGYTRYLSDKGPYEMQLVRLPDLVLLDAIYQSKGGPWIIRPRAASPHGLLAELMGSTGGPGLEHYSVMYLVPVDGSSLLVTLNDVVSWGYFEAAVTSELWAMSYQGSLAWGWHEWDFSNEMNPGWVSPDGRTMFGLEAVGGNVFFSTRLGDLLAQIEVWDEVQGTQPLVSFPSKQVGGACCLETDGEQLVWLQGSDYLGDNHFTEVSLMKSPFAASAAELQPTVVRPAYQDHVLFGSGVVGGGYAAYYERPAGAPLEAERFILTRLADGHYWVIPPRPGMYWVSLLYVDAEEVALIEDIDTNEYSPTHWTIVRLAIDSLGEPLPPGSGF